MNDTTLRAAVRRRTRRAVAAAALLLVLVLVAAVLPLGPALGAAAAPGVAAALGSGTPAGRALAGETTTADGGPALTLRELSPAVTRPGDELTVVASVTNTTDTVLEGAEVTLWVNWKRILARSALDAWARGDVERTATPQGRVALDPLQPGQTREVTLSVPIDALGFAGATRGPRELALTLRDGSTVLSAVRTFFLWDPAEQQAPDAAPVRLSLLAPVTGTPVDPADPLATDGLAGPTAPGGPLARTLAAVGTAEAATGLRGSLALAVDPALVATGLVSEDPQVAAWAGAVAELGERTDVRPLPAYDPDLAALARADLDEASLTAATTAPLAGSWSVPSTWGAPLAWPGGAAALDLVTLGAAATAGLPAVVVPAGLAPSRGTETGIARVTTPAGDITALVADPPVTRALTAGTDLAAGTDPSAGVPALSRVEMVQRLLAETAVVADQANGAEPHLLATLPRGWSPDVEALHVALAALSASGWVRITPITDLLAATVPAVERVPLPGSAPQDGELDPESVRRLRVARTAVQTLASVTAEPEAVLAEADPGLAAPTSVAWRGDPAGRAAAVDAAVDGADQLLSGLSVSVNTAATLISAQGSLPVTVRNDLPTDATVTVALRPDDPRLVVDERPTATIPASSEQRVQVPVRALASGDVSVEVRLLTADGTSVAEPVLMHLRVRAGWETVGTAVIAGAVALLFVAGIWRTIRRGRSARRTTDDALVDPVIAADLGRQ